MCSEMFDVSFAQINLFRQVLSEHEALLGFYLYLKVNKLGNDQSYFEKH